MPAYDVTAAHVRKLNGFPGAETVEDAVVDAAIEERAGELELLFAGKGAVLPVAGSDPLMRTLRLAIKYGAAITLLLGTDVSLAAEDVAALARVYTSEFNRIYGNLDKLTSEDLVRYGVTMVVAPSTPASTVTPLVLVGNASVIDGDIPWYDSYPYRRLI